MKDGGGDSQGEGFAFSQGMIGEKIHSLGLSVGQKEIFDLFHFLHGGVYSLDERNTDAHGDVGFQKFPQVFQNQTVVHPRIGSMDFGIQAFYVVQEKICVGQNPFKEGIGHVPCRINRRVDSLLFTFPKEGLQKVDLQHTLSSRKGDAP